MKLHLASPKNRNIFTGHGPGYVAVNGTAVFAAICRRSGGAGRDLVALAGRVQQLEPVDAAGTRLK